MYVKLFGTILDSSIWDEDHATVRLWITMLAMANQDGVVEASASGLGHRARITAVECKKALKILESPDIESKSQDYAGCRVEKIEGGWQLLNYQKYREMRSPKQIIDAKRQARHRQKQRDPTVTGVTDNDVTVEAEAEAEAEAVKKDSAPVRANHKTWLTPFNDEWAKTHGGTPFLKKGAKTGGELGKWLKIVKAEIAEGGIVIQNDQLNEMFRRWRSFLAEAGAFATPAKFAKEHGLHKGGKFVDGRAVRRAAPREPAGRTKTKLNPTISRGDK